MDKISKCLWIVEVLLDSKGLSLKDINNKWESATGYDGKPIHAKTFGRYKDYIGEVLGLSIEYSPYTRVYTIMNSEVLKKNKIYSYLLDAFRVSELKTLVVKHRDKIMINNPISGVEYLNMILQAIDNEKTISFSYQSYYTLDKMFHFEVIPCFVRLFEGRWYLICEYLDKSTTRVLALERMSEVLIGRRSVSPSPYINPEEYYADCYGIINDNKEAEVIKLKVYDKQVDYIRSLPLHQSQTEDEITEKYSIFSYYLKPSFDFMQKILWNMDKMEVVRPIKLREEIRNLLKDMLKRYS